jgi:hypothetical protein
MIRGFFSPTHLRRLVPVLACALLLLAVTASTLAAGPGNLKGRIRGTSRDMKGKPIAGLLVRLLLPGRGLVHVTNTDDRGTYTFEDLEAGGYDVEVSGSGYQRQVKKEIRVQPPFRNIVDFTLPPGPVAGGSPASPAIYQPPAGEPAFRDVTGAFTDKERRPIPDVALSLVNPATGLSFRAQSDREGKVLIRAVPAGIYRATVSSPGYVTVELSEAEVSPASGMSLKLSLVEYPLNFQGRPEDLIPEERPVPPDYRPPGP